MGRAGWRLTSGVALAVQHGGVGSGARPGRKKEKGVRPDQVPVGRERGAVATSGAGRQGEEEEQVEMQQDGRKEVEEWEARVTGDPQTHRPPSNR